MLIKQEVKRLLINIIQHVECVIVERAVDVECLIPIATDKT